MYVQPSDQCIIATSSELASIRLMSRQVSRGSAGEDQADDRAGVGRPSGLGVSEGPTRLLAQLPLCARLRQLRYTY